MKCVAFKPLVRGSLQGFADLLMPSGLVLLGCTLYAGNGRRWMTPPSRPQLDSERKLVLDGGKIAYAPVMFADAKMRFRCSADAVKAIEAYQKSKEPSMQAGSMRAQEANPAGSIRTSSHRE